MAEYIDRKTVVDIIRTADFWETEDMEVAITCVEQTPTADVLDVVRCKDCLWSRKVDDREPKYSCVNICRYGCTQWLGSDDYCSYGEPKDAAEKCRISAIKDRIRMDSNKWISVKDRMPEDELPEAPKEDEK